MYKVSCKVLTLSALLTLTAVNLGTPTISFAEEVQKNEQQLHSFFQKLEQYYQITLNSNVNLDGMDIPGGQKGLNDTIKVHQKDAKNHAYFWKNELHNNVIPKTLVSILEISEKNQKDLENLINQLGQELLDKNKIVNNLKNQNINLEEACSNLTVAITSIQKMNNDLTMDIGKYETDYTRITNIYDVFTQSTEKMIEDIQIVLNTPPPQPSIWEQIWYLGSGGRPGSYYNAHESYQRVLSEKRQEQEKYRNQLRQQIKDRDKKLEELNKAKSGLKELISITDPAANAIMNLHGQFQILKNINENILEHIEDATTISPKYITNELNTAQRELKNLNKLAQNIKAAVDSTK